MSRAHSLARLDRQNTLGLDILSLSGGSVGLDPKLPLTLTGTLSDHFDNKLRCEHCNREMKNEHSLNVHISRYHNQGQAPAQAMCPVCNKIYSNQYSLRTHMHLQATHHMTYCQITNYYAKIETFVESIIYLYKIIVEM